MRSQRVPVVLMCQQVVHRAQHMRQQRTTRAQAVAVNMAHIATGGVEKSVHLALGVMEAPRT